VDAKTICTPCAKYTFRSGDAAPENNVCKKIPAGYKEKSGAGVAARTQIELCGKGSVSFWTGETRTPSGTADDEKTCKSCADIKANSYAPRTGMAACTPCKGGFVPATSAGAAGPDSCTACGSGLFRNAFTNSATCTACAAGNEVGPSSRQACTQCRPGTFAASSNTDFCSQCPVSLSACLPARMLACLPAQPACLPSLPLVLKLRCRNALGHPPLCSSASQAAS
jgi:hypothetical protein